MIRHRIVIRLAAAAWAAALLLALARPGWPAATVTPGAPFAPALPDSVAGRLGSIREETRLLDEQIERAVEAAARGGEPLRWRPLLGGHGELLSRGTLDFLRGIRAATADTLTTRLLGRLEFHLARLTLQAGVAHLDDRATEFRARARVDLEDFDKPLTLNQLDQAIAAGADSLQRVMLKTARAGIWQEKLTPILLERRRTIDSLAVSLGYPGYLDVSEGLRDLHLEPLLGELFGFVRATDGMYQALFHELRPAAGDSPARAGRNVRPVVPALLDLALDAGRFDSLLGRSPARVLDEIRRGLGLGESAVDAPGDAGAGIEATEGRLRAAGLAWHRARPGTPAREFRDLEPDAPFHASGELLASVLFDSSRVMDANLWAPGLTEVNRLRATRQALFREIYRVRRDAALLLYEIVSHEGPDSLWTPYLFLPPRPEAQTVCREVLGYAGGVTLSPLDLADFAAHGQDFLAPAEEIRALALAAAEAEQMRSRFGPDWFDQPEAGAFLRTTIWAAGNDRPFEDLVRASGTSRGFFEALWRRWTWIFDWTEGRLGVLGE